MPEIGLGIGRKQDTFGGMPREILTWFDQADQPFPSSTEQAQAEAQRAQTEVERLTELLRSQGIDPNQKT